MKQVEMGDFRGGVQIKSYEEINILVASFNRMVQRMDHLISRVKLSSISEKNAQLQALQSQVNPHFLYNTLDMIYWMLDEKENDRLGKVVLALSQMFRYSSKWEVAEVSLKDEMMQVGHYLTIIRCRLGERVTTQIEVEDRWLHTGIPKMTLQPIIENAIKYGLEHSDRQGMLQIYTNICEKGLNIVIGDNGKGIDPVELQKVKDSLHTVTQTVNMDNSFANQTEHFDTKTTGLGIGLQNVHRRLILMFGENYGIHVESQLGEGTTVTVSVPYPGNGENIDEGFDRRR
jgi:two-component system sensor histidine kinase YesM